MFVSLFLGCVTSTQQYCSTTSEHHYITDVFVTAIHLFSCHWCLGTAFCFYSCHLCPGHYILLALVSLVTVALHSVTSCHWCPWQCILFHLCHWYPWYYILSFFMAWHSVFLCVTDILGPAICPSLFCHQHPWSLPSAPSWRCRWSLRSAGVTALPPPVHAASCRSPVVSQCLPLLKPITTH